jgi:hypothetical protein
MDHACAAGTSIVNLDGDENPARYAIECDETSIFIANCIHSLFL